MRVPGKVKAELEALIMFLESKGASGLTDTMCVVPVINTSSDEENRWAVAVATKQPGVYVPLAFLGMTIGQWDVSLQIAGEAGKDEEDEDYEPETIEPYFVKDPSGEDIMAAIPADALPDFNDDDLLCTDDDMDDDAWDEEMA